MRRSIHALPCAALLLSCDLPDQQTTGADQPSAQAILVVEAIVTSPHGYKVTLEHGTPPPGTTTHIAACDPWIVYAVSDTNALSVSSDSADTWTAAPSLPPGATSIACDQHRLYAIIPGAGLTPATLMIASTGGPDTRRRADGHFSGWTTSLDTLPIGISAIQSGDGVIFGWSTGGAQWYRNPLEHDDPRQATWVLLGTGTTTTGWGTPTLVNPATRAFRLDGSGGVVRNDTTFAGYSGTWSAVPTNGHTWAELSATMDPDPFHSDDPMQYNGSAGVLFGLTAGGEVYRMRFSESTCTDGVDNDADGTMDSADPAARPVVLCDKAERHLLSQSAAEPVDAVAWPRDMQRWDRVRAPDGSLHGGRSRRE